MNSYHLATLHRPEIRTADLSPFTMDIAESVRAFHRSFPMYSQTPLAHLENTARAMGLKDIYVKDESSRFGLNAFKVLGGSYAIGSVIASRLDMDAADMRFEMLTDPSVKQKLGELTFVTATDGNHGRGVAWSARRFGFKSVVYMPKGTVNERLENIRREDADAAIMDFNYDECVRLANRQAQQKGWIVVQDTAWEGYEEIPLRIMQGYMTMALEAYHQLDKAPTHIFLQAGVGSMAAAVAAFFANACGSACPRIVIVEPNQADCFYQSALAGERRFVTGDMRTIMAGLACGEPCTTAWKLLKELAGHCIACPDSAAAQGMRILGNPMPGDDRVISGESGASAFGCVSEIMRRPELACIRKALELDENAICLFFSTEGDTDRVNYRSIVWNGAHAPGI